MTIIPPINPIFYLFFFLAFLLLVLTLIVLLRSKRARWVKALCLERRAIVGLLPRADVLPVLALGLEATAQWEQRDNGLWLRAECLPDRRDQRDYPYFPPLQAPSLTALQQYEARLLIEQGYSMRQVAKHFGVSHGAIWRLMQKDR